MMRFLIGTAINLGSSAIGLLLAAWLIPGVRLTVGGFIIAVLIFTLAQAILTPIIVKLATRYAAPILSGIGLVTTFVALFVSTLFAGGLSIRGIAAWVLAPILVWVVTTFATWIGNALFLKNTTEGKNKKN